MGTIIRLVVAALILHGAWRAGEAYWAFYAFRDGVQTTAQFAGASSERDVRARVIEIASGMGVPVQPDRIIVRKDGNRTTVDASYVQPIEILPRYFYPWEFEVNVDVFAGGIP